jgi:hypothetical protein
MFLMGGWLKGPYLVSQRCTSKIASSQDLAPWFTIQDLALG